MGIRSLHAVISKDEEGKVFIEPICEGEDPGCYLNGEIIS